MRKAATISDCGKYRYWLSRVWDDAGKQLIFVMLNPSTADANIDDPTIRRCVGFGRDNGYGGIIVVNLFAFRATSPKDMKAAADPIGPHNDSHLKLAFTYAAANDCDVLAAWGHHGRFKDRDYAVANFASDCGVTLKCLAKTEGGDPRHPLYIKAETQFIPLKEV